MQQLSLCQQGYCLNPDVDMLHVKDKKVSNLIHQVHQSHIKVILKMTTNH